MKRKQEQSKTSLKVQKIEHCFEGCLYFGLSRIYRTIDRIAVDVFKELNIAPTHGYLIAALHEFGSEGATPSELSLGMNLDPSTVTRLISLLEKKKWIEKIKQGRVTKLVLTHLGRNQMREIDKKWGILYSRISDELGKNGIKALSSSLKEFKVS